MAVSGINRDPGGFRCKAWPGTEKRRTRTGRRRIRRSSSEQGARSVRFKEIDSMPVDRRVAIHTFLDFGIADQEMPIGQQRNPRRVRAGRGPPRGIDGPDQAGLYSIGVRCGDGTGYYYCGEEDKPYNSQREGERLFSLV